MNCVATSSVTVRRNVLEEIGGFNERYWIAEDFDLWLRICERHRIAFIDKVMYFYRNTEGSLTARPEIRGAHDANVEAILQASRERISLSRR